ncbi:hypothetical protein [Streptomyces sp. NPDC058240]|uniref:hypothetical protein n=1 Tax=Streptomyces sp. NPDC058240 TaxID=3346396 RepID=UPI0036ED9EB1
MIGILPGLDDLHQTRSGSNFRRCLEQHGLGYVVAVPKSQQTKSLAGIWRIDELIDEAPADAWQRLSCGPGAKGPNPDAVSSVREARHEAVRGPCGRPHASGLA